MAKRRPNFEATELSVMVTEITEHKAFLFARFSSTVTLSQKCAKWREIAAAMSAVGKVERTAKEVQDKWTKWSSELRKKAATIAREMRRTGGGTPSSLQLSALEKRALAVIPKESVHGIRGGMDAMQDCDKSSEDSDGEEEVTDDVESEEGPSSGSTPAAATAPSTKPRKSYSATSWTRPTQSAATIEMFKDDSRVLHEMAADIRDMKSAMFEIRDFIRDYVVQKYADV